MIGIKVKTDNKYAYVTLNYRHIVENGWIDDLQYLCDPTEHHERRYTFKVTTSIGVTRELNRHRVNSIAEQSTRYCNYSKDKFGNEVTFCIPSWMNIPEGSYCDHDVAFMEELNKTRKLIVTKKREIANIIEPIDDKIEKLKKRIFNIDAELNQNR